MNFKGKSEEEALFYILKSFFAKKTIQKTLRFIEEHSPSGCEKWLQIELLKYLFKTKQVLDNEIVKEELYEQDQRKDANRTLQRIDITFRLKHKKYYIALELKFQAHLSLAKIEEDLKKVSNSKQTEVYFRKVFALLLHPFQEQNVIEQKAEKREFIGDIEFSKKIPSTNLSYTVFSKEL